MGSAINTKPSFYNIFIPLEKEGEVLIYNSWKNSLLCTTHEIMEVLENHAGGDISTVLSTEDMDALTEYGMLIPGNFDEKAQAIKKDSEAFENAKADENYIDLTICPTYSCNLRCEYCFERGHGKEMPSYFMDKHVQDAILQVYEDHCARNLTDTPQHMEDRIKWYGGEPLLNIGAVDYIQSRINEIADSHGRRLISSMTTNGTLFNGETRKVLKRNRISQVQITIDGPPAIHNKKRYHPSYPDDSFDIIMDNIKNSDEYFYIIIRINIDRYNRDHLDDLLDIFRMNKIWPRKRTDIYLGNTIVRNGDDMRKAFTPLEFNSINTDFRKAKMKIYNDAHPDKPARIGKDYPVLNKTNCPQAVHGNAFVIGPKGELFSCWGVVGNNEVSYGNISEHLKEAKRDGLYKFDHEAFRRAMDCYDCKYLPICSVDCPQTYVYDGSTDKEMLCTKWRFTLKNVLAKQYKERTEHK